MNSPAPPSNHRYGDLLAIVAVLVLTGVAYSNSLDGGFFFDDTQHIVASRPDNFYTHGFMWNRPFVHLTIAANFRLLDEDPWGFHLVNVLIHAINSVLIYLLVRLILKACLPDTNVRLLAFLTAGLWTIHPVNTQAVNYTIQRCETMMSGFYVLMLLCHARGTQTGGWWWFAAACLAFWLGSACKEPIWLAPLTALALDWLVLRRSVADILSRKSVYVLYVLPALGAMFYFVPLAIRGDATIGGSGAVSPLMYLLTQSEIIAHYVWISLVPLNLCFDYAWPIASSVNDVVATGWITVLLFAWTVWRTVMRDWKAFFGIWFFLILAPSSSILPIQDAAVEHRMYLPSLAIVAAVVGGLSVAAHGVQKIMIPDHARPVVTVALAACLALPFMVRTRHRNLDYRDRLTLWPTVIETAPENARGYSEFAYGLIQAGRMDEAFLVAGQGVTKPNAGAWELMVYGVALSETGRVEEGLAALREARSIEPKTPEISFNLGVVCSKLQKWEEAEEQFAAAVELRPAHPGFRMNLAVICARLGKFAEAEEHLATILTGDPTNLQALFNRGVVAKMSGRAQEAAQWFRRVLRISPNHAGARTHLMQLQGA